MNGKYYRILRNDLNLTQAYVSQLIGVSRHSLSKYEKRETDMPLTVALKLNELYNIEENSELYKKIYSC